MVTMEETEIDVPTSEPPVLEVRGLRTRFATKGGWVRAVDGVDLTLHANETLGIVGESGSGKSVLGRTAMGLIRPDQGIEVDGEVELLGRRLSGLRPRQLQRLWGAEIGLVFQDPMTALNPLKKVGTHLVEGLRRHEGLSRADARARAIELLNQVRIPEPAHRFGQYPHELSGGMRQRVVIAMAIACRPTILIADEPTTALDVTVQKQILDLLDSLAHELGMATILISHDLGVVAGRAHRVAVMYAGRIVEQSETDRLFDQPLHPYTQGLLASIPRIDDPSQTVLSAIEGTPPDPSHTPQGCRFSDRCPSAQRQCLESEPELSALRGDEGRRVACHYPVGTPEGEQAVQSNRAAGITAAGLRVGQTEGG